MSEKSNVSINIIILRQLVKSLLDGVMPSGRHSVSWNGKDNQHKSYRAVFTFTVWRVRGIAVFGRCC